MNLAAPDRPVLEYPFAEPPEPGHALEVAPGVLWLRMPLPFSLDHINLWAIADGDGWTLVDTGIQGPQSASQWRRLLADELRGRPLTRVMVTHMHPDHVGMAGWLTRKFGCRLWMTRLEYLSCRVLVADTGRQAPEDGELFYRRAGWDEEAIDAYRARFGGFGRNVYALPESYRRLRDGDRLRIGNDEWQVVVGTGHSPEHACFWSPSRKLLVSGDQVLPRISSNVSVWPTEPEADPLADWLESLEALKDQVPADALALPSHGEPFRGVHERLEALARGHRAALRRLERTLAEPKRAVDVFSCLFARPVGDGLLGMATGESLAHLNYLLGQGRATKTRDADGVDWWVATTRGTDA